MTSLNHDSRLPPRTDVHGRSSGRAASATRPHRLESRSDGLADTVYDVTSWHEGNAFEDLGAVINSILVDVRRRQRQSESGSGRPGAVITIPPGDYHLRTQVVIDVSFLRIQGAGHGFSSSSIRFNVPEDEWPDLHELWPGGSRVIVDLAADDGSEATGAAFLVSRDGSPRISSVEFSGFCIDGQHFEADGSDLHAENTYVNRKTGIFVADANDSFRVMDMGFVYLEHALTVYNADALSINDNFIAECGSCIELRGWGQASKINDNLIGAGFKGHSIYVENHGGILITANNVFPRGASSIRLRGVTRSSVTNNRLHSFYPGMVLLEHDCSENLIASNHLLRDQEPWAPFRDIHNGLDDRYGLLRVHGRGNSVIGNHFSEAVERTSVRPADTEPVIIRLVAGDGNYIASNHVVASDLRSGIGESAFAAQVDALLSTRVAGSLAVTTVLVEADSAQNTVLDSGTSHEVVADRRVNAVRATPQIGE